MPGRTPEDDVPAAPLPPDHARRDFVGMFTALVLLTSGCGGGGSDSPPVAGPPPSPSPPSPSPSPSPPSPSPPAPSPPAPSPPAPPPSGLACGATAISINHGHVLTIPASDTDSATFKTYDIEGGADHNHTVTLLPMQLQQIKAGTAVTVNSSIGSSASAADHYHTVTVNCA
jgi:hypothetical protein